MVLGGQIKGVAFDLKEIMGPQSMGFAVYAFILVPV
jgi:hypothetical protein